MSDDRCHDLKVAPEFWGALEGGQKTFEVRYAGDRDFRVGDILHLREWDGTIQTPEGEKWTIDVGYTGREIYRRISYLLSGERWGLRSDYAALGLIPIAATPPPGDAGERARELLRQMTALYGYLLPNGETEPVADPPKFGPKTLALVTAALQSFATAAASQARRETTPLIDAALDWLHAGDALTAAKGDRLPANKSLTEAHIALRKAAEEYRALATPQESRE